MKFFAFFDTAAAQIRISLRKDDAIKIGLYDLQQQYIDNCRSLDLIYFDNPIWAQSH